MLDTLGRAVAWVGLAGFARDIVPSEQASGPSRIGRSVRAEATDLPYRPDVDGLRGIAVLAVIAFHAHFYQLPGGFAGVDVFFVISGFLITGILVRDLATGRFSFSRFYERRVRRIIPPLLVMIAAIVAVSLVLSSPERLHQLGRSLLFSSFFGTNILFANSTSYFDSGSVGQPLLHTWSLSVEEQYYLVYPALLFLLFWRRLPLLAPLLAVLAASLIFSEAQLHHSQQAGFYGTLDRAWELFAGGLLATGSLPRMKSRLACEALGFAGALAVAGTMLAYSPATRFPGFHALAPVLGTCAIIYAGGCWPTITNRGLAARPLVWIGLISYSLYLWHWPLLMLLRDLFGDEVRRRFVVATLLLSGAIAGASLFAVEIPVRRRRILGQRRQVLAGAAVGLFLAFSAGAALASSSGLLWRYPANARAVLDFANEDIEAWHYGSCFITAEEPTFAAGKCLRVDSARENVLLLGDSHAAHLRYGIEHQYPHMNLLQANASGCRPVLEGDGQPHCIALRESVMRQFLPRHRLDAIILSASWSNDETDIARIAATVAYLRRFAPAVLVIGPSPVFDRPEPDLLAFDIRFNSDLASNHLEPEIAKLDRMMAATAAREGWTYVSVYSRLCPAGRCAIYAAKGIPLYRDDSHFTKAGSGLAALALPRAAAGAIGRPPPLPADEPLPR